MEQKETARPKAGSKITRNEKKIILRYLLVRTTSFTFLIVSHAHRLVFNDRQQTSTERLKIIG
jgi:hypothetical protein